MKQNLLVLGHAGSPPIVQLYGVTLEGRGVRAEGYASVAEIKDPQTLEEMEPVPGGRWQTRPGGQRLTVPALRRGLHLSNALTLEITDDHTAPA